MTNGLPQGVILIDGQRWTLEKNVLRHVIHFQLKIKTAFLVLLFCYNILTLDCAYLNDFVLL